MVWREWVQMIIGSLVTVGAVYTNTEASLKNEIMLVACNCFITGLIFGTQNLIRDG